MLSTTAYPPIIRLTPLLLPLMLCWLQSAAALTITPSSTAVSTGQRITLTANDAKGKVYWSALKGIIVSDSKQATYSAPNEVGKDIITIADDDNVPVTLKLVIQPPAAQNVPLSLENGVWEIFSNRDNIQALLLSDDQRILWVGTNGGLEQRNAHTGELLKVYTKQLEGLPDNWISSLLSDTQGGLWIGTYDGLAHLNAAGQWQVNNTSNSGLPHNDITSLLSDAQGGLWVGTYDGLAHLNAAGQWQVFKQSNSGLPDNWIFSLLSDAQGGLWAGTYAGGLAHLNAAGQWQVFNKSNSGLPDNWINDILSDAQGGLWVGTGEGLAHLNATEQWQVFNKSNSGLPDNFIHRLLSDIQGGLWVGTDGGLARLNAAGQWQVFNKSNSGLPDKAISRLLSDAQGGLWGGTYAGGLAHLNAAGQWQVVAESNSGLPNNAISRLLSDAQGGLWVGTYAGGLAHRNAAGQWQVFNKSNSGLPDNWIENLLSDTQGGLWVGTDGGLARLNATGQWQVFHDSNSGLPGNYINSLFSDTQGGLWIGTNGGGLAHLTFTAQSTLCQQFSAKQCEALLTSQRAAILIAGGGKHQDNLLWETTNSISNNLYRTLNKRGFNNDEIFYLSPNTEADFNGDGFSDHIVDAPKAGNALAVEDIQAAIDWATQRGKMDQPLYLFFVDHGGADKFQLSQNNTLAAKQLQKMLDSYQAQTGNEIVIVLDASFAGSIGKQLAAPKRAVITSTDDGYAFFNTQTYQGFTRFLAKGLSKGLNFNEAFTYASSEQQKLLDNLDLRVAVTGGTQPGTGAIEQKPQKFDNNQINTLDKLYLNGSFVTGDSTLVVSNMTSNTTQSANTPISLKVNASVAQGKVERVWAVIRPPRMDLLLDQYQTPILAFPRVELSPVSGKDNQWQTTWSDTRYNGQYSITFYAKDKDGDIISSDSNTVITITQGIDPPLHATTQIQLNQTQFKAGDTLKAQVTEELNWGYDLYLAVVLPSGGFVTLNDKNSFKALNQANPWRGKRQPGQAQEFINLTLPELPAGQYCLTALLSPEQENVFLAQSYWKASQQCFRMQ